MRARWPSLVHRCCLLSALLIASANTCYGSATDRRLSTAEKLLGARDISGAVELYRQVLREEEEGQAVCAAHIGLGQLYSAGELSGSVSQMNSHFRASASCGHAHGLFLAANLRSSGWVDEGALNMAKGLTEYHHAAMDGHIGALLTLGYRARFGRDTPKDCKRAATYYELAANMHVDKLGTDDSAMMSEPSLLHKTQLTARPKRSKQDVLQYFGYAADTGDRTAAYALGKLSYEGGWGVDRDHERAAMLFSQGADAGHAPSMSALGHMFLNGHHFPRNRKRAYDLFSEAAKQDNAAGMVGLAMMLVNQSSSEEDAVRAYDLNKRAAAMGNAQAMYNHAVLHMGGGPSPYSRDYRKAMHLFTLAGIQGHVRALHSTAHMQLNGIGGGKDCEAATKHFAMVAEHLGLKESLHRAHTLHQSGHTSRALILYNMAAQQGSVTGQLNAAWIYQHECAAVSPLFDINGDDNAQQQQCMRFAATLLEQASEQGKYWADVALGDVLYYGSTGTVDVAKAGVHYRRAASKAKNARAMFNIAYMHQFGIGMQQDLPLAERFYDMSLEVDSRSWGPVTVALVGLRLHRMYLSSELMQGALAWAIESDPEDLIMGVGLVLVVLVAACRRLC